MTRFCSRFLVPVSGALLIGCAANATGSGTAPGALSPGLGVAEQQQEAQAAAEAREQAARDKPEKIDRTLVARSALPFHGFRVKDHQPLAPDQLLRELASADVVCIGEQHDNPHDHWAELRILRGLAQRAKMSGRVVGLGLEMVQKPYQKALDRYSSYESDSRELMADTDWAKRWGYPFSYYQPMLALARSRQMSIVALNAPSGLTHQIAAQGLESLDDEQQKKLPDLDLHDAQHRAFFDQDMKGHPDMPGRKRDMYAAQVVWDESMADAAASWLGQNFPARQLVIFAGSSHCRRPAIVRRIERRMAARVVSVRPLIEQGGHVDPLDLAGYDYGFIMEPSGDAPEPGHGHHGE